MEPIKTQDVWMPISDGSKNPLKWVVQTSDNETIILEKKSDMVVMTVEEFKKVIVSAMNKGSDYFLEDVGTWEAFKTEYINQLIKP